MLRSQKLFALVVVLFTQLALIACSGADSRQRASAFSAGEPSNYAPGTSQSVTGYDLGAGDKTRLIVFGQPDLSGEFVVDSEGMLSLPLIGQVFVLGSTIRQAEQKIAQMFRQGYLNDPRVNLEVLNYRPFFIFGEIEEGGEYDYQSGITIYNAIALAGGYTYRADRSKVFIAHKGSSREIEYPASQETPVQPGDVIRVPEKFF